MRTPCLVLLAPVPDNGVSIFGTNLQTAPSFKPPSDGFLARFKSSWTGNYSIFSWADKGRWESVQTQNRQVTRQGEWFRIGFEPLFVDYTQRGTWFVVISLLEVSTKR